MCLSSVFALSMCEYQKILLIFGARESFVRSVINDQQCMLQSGFCLALFQNCLVAASFSSSACSDLRNWDTFESSCKQADRSPARPYWKTSGLFKTVSLSIFLVEIGKASVGSISISFRCAASHCFQIAFYQQHFQIPKSKPTDDG